MLALLFTVSCLILETDLREPPLNKSDTTREWKMAPSPWWLSPGLADLVEGGMENFRLPPVGVLLKTVPYPRGSSTGSNKKPRFGNI